MSKRGGGINNPLTDTKDDARLLRLAAIAERHLEKLERLPFPDRLTVASTLLGSLVMQIDPSQQEQLLKELFAGLRRHFKTEGLG